MLPYGVLHMVSYFCIRSVILFVISVCCLSALVFLSLHIEPGDTQFRSAMYPLLYGCMVWMTKFTNLLILPFLYYPGWFIEFFLV